MINTSDLPKNARRWGRWVLHDGCLCLPDGDVAYEIPVPDLLAMLGWWFDHMASKAWVSAQDIYDLGEALADLDAA